MAIAEFTPMNFKKKKKLKKIKALPQTYRKLSSWFGGKKKEEEEPTVGKKVGQETLDAIKKRKKALDELMG